MSNVFKMILLLVLFGLLILIRAFENELFYDPYLTFFKNDYLYVDNPRREILKLTLFTTLRYVLNSAISLGIIFIFFNDWNIVKFSTLIYVVSFLILLAFFLYFVINPSQEDYYIFFNIRRFLIQPLLLLLLLPAFYYHKLKSKKS
ncbi:exosortase F-associated protein [Gelidibacter algens]|jgi:exosortase F-associated protein|uniref:Exosortase F-associated protein n=1 Tax=Gelidibacter algens TaxID=49280 RepID=A0A1A7R3T9_9FLAO|nr:exosortase F system-associated protein [Gelidibacter algens]OBX25437.1 exosortase F system-associated protein [Gelidibacter algens]RAJ22354.1 exosortase F-associated protein [Gelidibacter algens]